MRVQILGAKQGKSGVQTDQQPSCAKCRRKKQCRKTREECRQRPKASHSEVAGQDTEEDPIWRMWLGSGETE